MKLVNSGLLIPIIVKTRVRSYQLSDFSRINEKKILKKIIVAHRNAELLTKVVCKSGNESIADFIGESNEKVRMV